MDGSRTPVYEKLEMLIDGQWCQGSEGKTEDVLNPATGAVVDTAPSATAADLDRAVAAARRAFPGWAATDIAERARLIGKAAGDRGGGLLHEPLPIKRLWPHGDQPRAGAGIAP